MKNKKMFNLLIISLLGSLSSVVSAKTFECLIEPEKIVDISSPVVGLLDKVYVRRGDEVKQGQVLARLESSTEQAAAELARFKSKLSADKESAENKIKPKSCKLTFLL